MQTTVQREKSIRFGSGILSVSSDNGQTFKNLGALKDAKLGVTKKVTEIIADNAKLPPKVKIDKATMSASLYEIYLDNIQTIDGMAEYTAIAGTLTTVTGENLQATGSFAGDTAIFFANKNGDGTRVSSITVKNGTTSLVEGTDYEIILLDGKTGIVRVGDALTLTGAGLTVDYSYTPNTSKSMLFKDLQETLSMNMFKFENRNSDNKVFSITFFKAYNSGNIDLTFPSDNADDSAMTLPIEITAFPTDSQQLFEIYDEQDVL